MANYNNKAINDLYNAQAKAKANQLNQARIQAQLQLGGQVPTIQQAGNTQRSQIDTVSRMNALGNNERLANQGLAGGTGQAPTSGYSETSRQRDNTTLRTGLNNSLLQQQGAINKVNSDVQNSNLTIAGQKAQQLADIAEQQGTAQIGQFNTDRNFESADKISNQKYKEDEEKYALDLIDRNSLLITVDKTTGQVYVKNKAKLKDYINNMHYGNDMKNYLYAQYNLY